MNENAKNKQIESILRKAHVPEPSAELKERITTEAVKSWNKTMPESSWQIPVRRLLVSAAAAVFVIWLANSFSDYALARWQPGGLPVTHQQPSDLDALSEIPYSSLLRQLLSTGRKSPITEASTLRNYAETVLRILDEAQQNGAPKPLAPVKGKSRLLPKQPGHYSYS